MSTPAHSISTRRGRMYVHPRTGVAVPSVTTICGVLDKPALPRWAAKMTAQAAVEHHGAVAELIGAGEDDAAVDLLKGAPWRSSGRKAQAGTNVHEAVEAWLTGVPRDNSPEEDAHVEQYQRVHARLGLDALYVEAQLWNHTVGYAGSVDLIARDRDGVVWVLDVKTGKGPYPEHALQLAAYAHAEEIVRVDGTTEPMPEVEAGAVIDLKANRHRVIPAEIGADTFKAFRAARVAWDFLGRDLFGEAV